MIYRAIFKTNSVIFSWLNFIHSPTITPFKIQVTIVHSSTKLVRGIYLATASCISQSNIKSHTRIYDTKN